MYVCMYVYITVCPPGYYQTANRLMITLELEHVMYDICLHYIEIDR